MVDFSAIARWPNVPACYEWLSLDRRGDWRLQGERIMHRGLIEFINRQYACDTSGCWFLQNGPQRVFVDLAYTPWVFHREGEGFVSHSGRPAGALQLIHLDDHGCILLEAELGIGLLDDRDLAGFLARCDGEGGGPVSDDALPKKDHGHQHSGDCGCEEEHDDDCDCGCHEEGEDGTVTVEIDSVRIHGVVVIK